MYILISKLALLAALAVGTVGVSSSYAPEEILPVDGTSDCFRACMHDPGSGCDGNSRCCTNLCN
jgi:hypothetical protein